MGFYYFYYFLSGKSATIVYADHTIVVHDLNPTLSQSWIHQNLKNHQKK